MSRRQLISSLALAALVGAASPASAALTLTSAGVSDGFTLSTFISGWTGSNPGYGPVAEGILPNGNVLTGDELNSNIYVFQDIDNQTLASAVSVTPYAYATKNPNYAIATAGGLVYGAQLEGGNYEKFNSDGTKSALTGPIASVTDYLGMWGDPTDGHLISASNSGLIDINPLTGTFRVINAGLFPDGVTVTADGQTIYVQNGGAVQSYNSTTGALIQTYSTGHAPDGTGVISGGVFSGDVIVNNNDGTVGLLDPITSAFTIIASGGSRGDFVSPDTTNGTLFISQFEQVARLTCGPGCSIGSSAVPEPATWAMMLIGFGGIGFMMRGSRRKQSGAITAA